ncbi:hypothetical protein GOD95_00900 [Paeniclostridium sordellii]|uniref:hypothetical protein n=1 Tax=Paraclostridium sordellii TaxID=1505 RepID=UPI0012EECB46|nr:hypothetical protein [Paeniclostridium sordellii]MVO70002.1 hypothetical protein [Paeniclostridium sordellii]
MKKNINLVAGDLSEDIESYVSKFELLYNQIYSQYEKKNLSIDQIDLRIIRIEEILSVKNRANSNIASVSVNFLFLPYTLIITKFLDIFITNKALDISSKNIFLIFSMVVLTVAFIVYINKSDNDNDTQYIYLLKLKALNELKEKI